MYLRAHRRGADESSAAPPPVLDGNTVDLYNMPAEEAEAFLRGTFGVDSEGRF